MKKIRCAIYTRKSSENGLEQEFNSLDAQREACAAYISSQKHEGWMLLPDHYDDGGISGGTLERESLQRLLADVDEGRVDQIVVYKIDRLTRSLADFAKLVERLDEVDASFVSVTQSFNTATSMGRLTLNVLLSFAQFEREVTSERIRDKIAASKKKGLWMGGNVPLGYDPDGRSLTINEEESQTIRRLYALYQEHQTIIGVKTYADKLDLRTKAKPRAGRVRTSRGNRLFERSHIYYILTNPIYAGRIRHGKIIHEGLHPAIIDPTVWDQVQEDLITSSSKRRGITNRAKNKPLLIGKLFDETGDRFTPSYAVKQGVRYRYYVSNRLLTKSTGTASNHKTGWRLAARPLEQQLANAVVSHLKAILVKDMTIMLEADSIVSLHTALGTISENRDRDNVLACIRRAELAPGNIQITLCGEELINLLGSAFMHIGPNAITFDLPFQHRKRGVETKFVIGDAHAERDHVLIQNLAKANCYLDAFKAGKAFEDIAKEHRISTRRLMQIIDLAFLAPDIVKSVMQSSQPVGFTSEYLQRHPLPSNWHEQRQIVITL